MGYVFAVIICYLLGSISFSYLFGKWFKGIDIRKHGSGNAGATNTLRVLGPAAGFSVLILDILKGVAAVCIGWAFNSADVMVPLAAGIAVIVGHNWPIFFSFRGGKGIATTIGVIVTLCFVPALIAALAAVAIIALTRYVSLGSLMFTVLLPILLWQFGRETELIVFSLIVAVFAFYRHRSNIVKLVQGKENKLSFQRSNR